jgi:uncharacterized repeat protein (TIGR02543 family)
MNMKKLFTKGSIVLLSAMLVLAFAACPTEGGNSYKPNDKAFLDGIQVVVTADGTEVEPDEIGVAISSSEWNSISGMNDIEGDKISMLDFNSSSPVTVTFTADISRGAKATYAVVNDGDTKPTVFKALTEQTILVTNYVVFVKVVSENGNVTNYYCFEVIGAGSAASTNVSITQFMIGDEEPINPAVNQGSTDISLVTLINYELPGRYISGPITLQLSRNNANQKISWAKVDANDTPVASNFTEFDSPDSGNILSAAISTNGLQNGEKIYIKIIAANNETVRYYGFSVSVGNIAELASLTLGSDDVTDLGTPGTEWNTATIGIFDYQGDASVPVSLAAIAKDGNNVKYAIKADNTEPVNWTAINSSTTIQLQNGIFLYIQVTSVNGYVTKYYKINIVLKASTTVLYGQPDITLGTSGGAPPLDPLWATQDWQFDVSRINRNEMIPVYKFLNTVNGHYDVTGYGHTQGKAKAFWDDFGIYVYAEMTFHDYLGSEGASSTARTTVVTPPVASVTDSNAHLYDSLEIFTNERVQQYTQGGYGIQYRVAPSPDGATVSGTNSRISGNPPNANAGAATNAISIFRDSGKYYTWIRNEGGKEVGYSVIAYIPWIFQNDSNATAVFGTDGKVKTIGNDNGPTIGAEFQLNTATVGGSRDAILTWNGINGQSYNQVKNYGSVKMVTGDLSARNINRGDKDPVSVTITFDTNGGTPANINPIQIPKGHAAGGAFPENPVKDNFRFTGWYDESVTPNKKYDSVVPITKSLTLKARWAEGTGDIVFSLVNWMLNPPSTINSSSSPRPLARSTSNVNLEVVDDSIKVTVTPGTTTIGAYHGVDLFIDDTTASASNGGGAGLNLDPREYIYEVIVTGYVNGTPPAGEQMMLVDQNDAGIFKFSSEVLTSENAAFTVIGMLPENSRDTTRIRIRSTSGVITMPFVITGIEVINNGPR